MLDRLPGCLAAIHKRFRNLPIVGYERDRELVIAETLGFKKLGPLRVWTHQS